MEKHYFVTGSTGAVGSALISLLLESKENTIWALMRGDSEEYLKQRLEKLIDFWEMNDEKANDARKRIIPVKGDMDENNFGIDSQHYHDITEKCTHIIHCAGVVRMNLPLDVARKHAVDSARNVISLALSCKSSGNLKKVEVVSTVGVGGRMSISIPETWITEKREFHNTYEASKAEAEDFLKKQIETHQLPVTIHRPSMVVGDSKMGKIIHFQVFYHLCEFLSGRRSFGLAPLYGQAILDTIPVDYVAQVLKWSSENEMCIGKVFHLSSGPELSIKLTELRRVVRKSMMEHKIKVPKIISFPSYLFNLAIKMVTPFLDEKIQRAVKVLPVFLDYLKDEQLFGSAMTRKFIEENGGPEMPMVNSYLERVLGYYLVSKQKDEY